MCNPKKMKDVRRRNSPAFKFMYGSSSSSSKQEAVFTRASELNHTRTEQQLTDCKKKTNEGVSDRSFSLISLPSYSKQKQSVLHTRSLLLRSSVYVQSDCLLLREYLYIFLSFFPHSFYTKRYFCVILTYPPSYLCDCRYISYRTVAPGIFRKLI